MVLHLYNSTVALDHISLSLVLSVSMLKRSRAARAVSYPASVSQVTVMTPVVSLRKLYDPNTNKYAFFSRNQ